MAVLKPEITGKYSQKRKKQQTTENQENTKTEVQLAKWGPGLYI